MSRFRKCAKVAHAKLRTFFPQITLGQTQQILASALGHKTYASFLASDLSEFDSRAAYAVLVPEVAMLRAMDFMIELTKDHWALLIDEIREKQVVGDLELCESLDNVMWRARYEFFEGDDSAISDFLQPYGTVEVFRHLRSEKIIVSPEYVDAGETLSERINVTLHGSLNVECSSRKHGGWEVPVETTYVFEPAGRRLLAGAKLTSIQLDGEPRESNPYEDIDLHTGGMTFD